MHILPHCHYTSRASIGKTGHLCDYQEDSVQKSGACQNAPLFFVHFSPTGTGPDIPKGTYR